MRSRKPILSLPKPTTQVTLTLTLTLTHEKHNLSDLDADQSTPHPYHFADKIQGSDEEKKKAEEVFRDIAEGYAVLHDKELRAKYDRGEDVSGQAQQQQQHGFPGGFPGGFGGGQQFHFHFRL